MSKEFDDLIKAIPKYVDKKKKEEIENDLVRDYDEERDDVYIMLWTNVYTFDQKGYRIFDELWDKGVLMPNKDNYLCVKDEWGDLIPVHRFLKMKEVEELAKKLNCPVEDIHVHHRSIKLPDNKFDNRLLNLEVLHKDTHAERHGFGTWEEYQRYLKDKEVN